MIKEKIKLAGKKVADKLMNEDFVNGIRIGMIVVGIAAVAEKTIIRSQFKRKATPIERQYLEGAMKQLNEQVIEILKR